jgi:serine protease Do
MLVSIPAAAQTADRRAQADELRAEMERARQSGYLGVYLGELTEAKAKQLKVDGAKGALVERVIPNSPAEKAGVRAGDVVVGIDGRSVASEEELRDALRAHKKGDSATLEIVRDGKRQKVEVTLGGHLAVGPGGAFAGPEGFELFRGQWPEGFERGEPYVMMFPGAPRLGVSVLPMTDDLRDYFGVEHGKGVLVSAVSKGSAAERAGLRAGDVVLTVDGQPVARAGDIARALRSKEGDAPRTVQLEVMRERGRLTLSATVEAPRLLNEV